MENTKIEIKKFKVLPSTNRKAKELVLKGIKPWTVILAEKQTAGYGRKGSSWFSPKGGLYFSVILPKSKIEDLQTLTILAAFIVTKVIKENFNLEPQIKLPNDILLNGKKVAGILTENVVGASACSAPTLSDSSTSSESSRGGSRDEVERVGKEVKFSVMGIGLNTNIRKFSKDLENTATSLKIELGRNVDNEMFLEKIIKELKEQLRTISA